MSDLETLRDHARRLSTADHRDDCERIHRIVKVDCWLSRYGLDQTLSCADETGHESHVWQDQRGFDWCCPGLCGGCMIDRERALWEQIAGELAAYLGDDDDDDHGPDLFGESA